MKQVEKQMCAAIKAREGMNNGNTVVIVSNEYCDVVLHGNHIARIWNEGWKDFTLAGWNSNVTRSRLNALGCDVCSRQKKPICIGHEIADNKWYRLVDMNGRKHLNEL